MKYITSVWEEDTRKHLKTVKQHKIGQKGEEEPWRVTLT
jgi:hypothetical protein